MKRKWLSLLAYGITSGVFIGCISGLNVVLRQSYLSYHMYNTAARTMAGSIDYYLVAATISVYVLALAIALDKLLPGRARVGVRIAVIAGLLYYTITVFGLRKIIRGLTVYVISFASEGKSELLYAAACLILGGLLLRYLKRTRSASHNGESSPGRTVHLGSVLKYRWRVALVSIIFALIVNAVSGILWARTSAAVRTKPNIIFIMVDTLRADHVGFLGYSRNTTPNIDRLANEGIVFDRAIAQAPWTTWSVGSMLSSQYPEDMDKKSLSVDGDLRFCSDRIVTIAEVLKDQGYATGAVISNVQASAAVGFNQGFDVFDESACDLDISSPRVCSIAESTISRFRNRRFFLFALFNDPHSPYIQHDQFNFNPGYEGKELEPIHVTSNGDDFVKGNRELAVGVYDSEIRFTDYYIGQFLETLKKEGLYDNSVIVLFSDHGEEFDDHGGFFHGETLYNELLHVPLIIKLPQQNSGRVVSKCFPLINIFPSLLQFLSYDDSTFKLKGDSEDLTNRKSSPSSDAFSATNARGTLRSMERTPYKCVMDVETMHLKLFNTVQDPTEKQDIAASRPDVVRVFRQTLLERKKDDVDGRRGMAGSSGEFTEKQKSRLRSLGYIQ